MIPMSPTLARVYEGLRHSERLDKLAAVAGGEELAQILTEKAASDNATFELAKQASVLEAGLGAGRKFLGSGFGKGMAVAAGAAIPTVMAGNAISNHATEQARNRALETGAGLAAIGGTMYGLHRMANRGGQKRASVEEAELAAVDGEIQKLAAVGYLDVQLSDAIESATEEGAKLASELRSLNREHGIEILTGLVTKQAGIAGELAGETASVAERIAAKLKGMHMPRFDPVKSMNATPYMGAAAGAVPGALIGAQNEDHPIAGALYGGIGGAAGGGAAGFATKQLLGQAAHYGLNGGAGTAKSLLRQATGVAAAAPLVGAGYGLLGTQLRTPKEEARRQLKHRIKAKLGIS